MFTNRIVEEWNKLGKHVISAGTVDTCKKRLDIPIDEENKWYVLSVQELPCVGQLAFCSIIIFLCSNVLMIRKQMASTQQRSSTC